jgi:uncharacterized protein (TIGR03435 family)
MRTLTLLLFTLAPCLFAEGPEFEVASIKPFDLSKAMAPGGGGVRFTPSGGGPGTADPTHMTQMTTAKGLLANAFDVKGYQIIGGDTATDMFEFALVVPEGATKDDVKVMWRNLLISRFGLKFHKEQRELQADELVVGPRGHKLTENTDPEPGPLDPNAKSPLITTDKDGIPVLPRPGLLQTVKLGAGTVMGVIVAKAQPMSALATLLANQLNHPVVDKTGLTGKYDFRFEFVDPRLAAALRPAIAATQAGVASDQTAAAEPAMELTGAIQQIGLRLAKGKAMVDVIVIDRIERTPTEN